MANKNLFGRGKLVEGASLFPYSEYMYDLAYLRLMNKPPPPAFTEGEAALQWNYTGRKRVDREYAASGLIKKI